MAMINGAHMIIYSKDAEADQCWGQLTSVHLPGGGKLGLYQPRRERA